MRPSIRLINLSLLLLVVSLALASASQSSGKGSGKHQESLTPFQKHWRALWGTLSRYYAWGTRSFNCFFFGTDCAPASKPSTKPPKSASQAQELASFAETIPPSTANA
jgi:hypothetical protein